MPANDEPKRPTIDERLEALAQNVELMQHDYEHRFRQIAATFTDALASIQSLERIATAHERRITHLEGE